MQQSSRTILIIEDEQSIADTVVHSVEKEGYAAVWKERGLDGLAALQEGGFALAVLDIGLPDIGGFDLLRAIREFSGIPVIFLTARDDEVDKVVGLEIGADDYITKPFSPRELSARIKSVLRRSGAETRPASSRPDATLSAPDSADVSEPAGSGPRRALGGALLIDEERLQASYHGYRLELTRFEFRLLSLLASRPGRVYAREDIMRLVWGEDSPSLDRSVDAHVKSLRAKFRALRGDADPILTHRGTGYALREEEA